MPKDFYLFPLMAQMSYENNDGNVCAYEVCVIHKIVQGFSKIQ